jgi:hypothetical protein
VRNRAEGVFELVRAAEPFRNSDHNPPAGLFLNYRHLPGAIVERAPLPILASNYRRKSAS